MTLNLAGGQGQGEKALLRLLPKHRAFVAAFLRHYNATQAVLEVYGCTYGAAKVQGSRLMARDDVRRAIDLGTADGGLLLQMQTKDALKAAVSVCRGRKTKPAVKIRAARLIAQIAGAIQPRRR